MYHYPTCDWCGGEIRGQIATITPGGDFQSGKAIDLPELTYHTSHKYDQCKYGVSENSCLGHVLALLNLGGEFRTPDAGMEWKLVPASEGHHYNDDGYRSEVLGTTPLAELGLSVTTYRKLTKGGVFTVEHVADMRARGVDGALTVKQLGLIDAALLERGLLPEAVQ